MPKKRRGKKEGSVFQRADGKWVAQISLKTLAGGRRRVTRHAKSKAHALMLLSELQRDRPELQNPGTPVTLESFLRAWLKTAAETCQASTISVWRSLLTNHCYPRIGGHLLCELDVTVIDSWLTELRDAGIGDRARSSTFSTLRTALTQAEKRGLIKSNPCKLAKAPSYQRKKIDPFTIEESKKILKDTKGTPWAIVMEMGLLVGLRQEEIFGLRWRDVHLDSRTLRITQVAAETEGVVSLKDPKTKSSIRTVSLPTSTVQLLKSLQSDAAGELLLENSRGNPVQRSNFGNRVWRPLLKKLELRHRGFHHTRHTAATTMLRAGVPVHIVSRQLGHARASITLDIYAHCLTHDTDQAANVMDNLFNG